MCRFDRLSVLRIQAVVLFQYISCVGSILIFKIFSPFMVRFQYISCVGSIKKKQHLQQHKTKISIHLMCRFDCRGTELTPIPVIISIHLMCRFDFMIQQLIPGFLDFNTSHVSVRLRYIADQYTTYDAFQYISCVGSI